MKKIIGILLELLCYYFIGKIIWTAIDIWDYLKDKVEHRYDRY